MDRDVINFGNLHSRSNNKSSQGNEDNIRELVHDMMNSLNVLDRHAMASSPDGQDQSNHQAQLRRQAPRHPRPAVIRRFPSGGILLDQDSLVLIDRENGELDNLIIPDRYMMDRSREVVLGVSQNRFIHIDRSGDLIAAAQDRENQRAMALQADLSDPELAQPDSQNGQDNTGWSIVNTFPETVPPCPRSLHSAVIWNDSLYIFGGYNGHVRVNDFHAYSFGTRRWSPVLPAAHSGMPPSPRDRHVSVVHGNTLYIFGGFDGTSRTNDFYGFDFSSMTWREIVPRTGRPPSERHSHASVVHGNSMYVFGGYDGSYK
jgi:Galactose oxidase, central domain/Kelch motif